MQDSTSLVKVEWSSYIGKAETHYTEDTAAVESGKKDIEEVLQKCLQKAKMGQKQWSSAQESLLSLEKTNVASVDDIIRELKSGHYHKTVEITEDAGKCLLTEYVVDQPSCSTPKKRSFNLPSITSIEELRTPAFEELLKSFWESKASKLANGDIKQHILGDSRVPLTAIN
uniref:Uncharacterized protein n=1 Tax=Daucus carota subsp. sativus TaxID=79200 RepID=A0A166DF31_DAUCS